MDEASDPPYLFALFFASFNLASESPVWVDGAGGFASAGLLSVGKGGALGVGVDG